MTNRYWRLPPVLPGQLQLFSWLFQARFIGQSLGANWLAEPPGHMVPLSIPERCHPAAAYAQLASSVVEAGGGGVWQLPEEAGAAASPGTRQEMERNRASVKAAKNTRHCHFKQREEVAADGTEDRVREMMRISGIQGESLGFQICW